ncbi:uncharacterized protein si:dkey-260g12.1 isoform X2 [Electrophorus electricus]|uniref:uncharacterized protein si:dkey-260g12.1 isoform X2 n=1 Tax=Electrophorus electricus TaxID=8005 RepID=UPI0015D015DF|nr:uncharacterized protein si:dkey-260g12.1 isoform X2 [Electrophorus electricus]XP_026862540.2 uncharacterized protein si:dkey-260g12.1 isoform X2 [Electrophorus electricus]XP_035387048.1 uncharacterized protein si:dkey-260g12.1 isoform X2 [Electrophorus electricus]
MSLKTCVMVILMGGLISGLPLKGDNECKQCPPGKYMLRCNECSECPEDSFTSKNNRERSCHSCFRDCRPELNRKVVTACTNVSDVVCDCMTGFVCHGKSHYSGQCLKCEPKTNSTTHPPSHPPSTSAIPKPHGMSVLWVIAVVLLSTLLTITITFLFCRRRKKECLKQLVKRCSLGNPKEDHNTTSSEINKTIKEIHTQEMNSPTFNSSRSDCPTHHISSTEQPLPPAGNLGPLHIYGAGTVFVSLLNQFGQNGGDKEEDDLGQQALDLSEMHCPTSPPLPLSKEERSMDGDYVSFPSQEQGKECHVSKEEGL